MRPAKFQKNIKMIKESEAPPQVAGVAGMAGLGGSSGGVMGGIIGGMGNGPVVKVAPPKKLVVSSGVMASRARLSAESFVSANCQGCSTLWDRGVAGDHWSRWHNSEFACHQWPDFVAAGSDGCGSPLAVQATVAGWGSCGRRYHDQCCL